MKNLAKWLIPAFLLPGCATQEYVQDYVRSQLQPANARLGALERRADGTDAVLTSSVSGLEATSKRLDETLITLKVHTDRLDRNEADIARISKTAEAALERAAAAGKLAEGKMAYEVVLSEDNVKFTFGKAQLGKAAKLALDEFAAQVKSENRGVYIEVQGHTDSIGSTAANLAIGQQRAEAVRRYLHAQGGIPLHRLAAMSYGETMPVASNRSDAGRARNRRVVLVVLY